MNALAINDLSISSNLDRAAMTAIKGGADWVLKSSYISTGSWSAYSLTSQSYQGQKFNDGYLSKHYVEGWKRTRNQTEYSTWDHFVKV